MLMTSSEVWFEFDETEFYEQQGDHQKLKHKFIETYMHIWVENVGHNSKKSPPSIDFFDLYAASGWATNEKHSESWPGSALILAKNFGEYPNPGILFLNTYHSDKIQQEAQVKILQKSVEDLEDCPHVFSKTKFCQKEIVEATTEALKLLNRSFPSVWVLDPYGPSQLPWEIVRAIATATGGYSDKKGNWIEKRPELIITFMTSILQRFGELYPEMIKLTFDLDEMEWNEKFASYAQIWKKRGYDRPTRHVVLDIYLEKLSEYYHLPILLILVPGKKGQIVYAMIHCTNNVAGHYMMKKKLSQVYDGYKVYEWSKGEGLRQILTGGQTTLFKF
jgi:three-Cys-motif partner protein